MKCYNHHDRDAFVVCKSCGRALCLECEEKYKNTHICKDSESCHDIAEVAYRGIYTCMVTKIIFIILGFTAAVYAIGKMLIFPFGFTVEAFLLLLISYICFKIGFKAKVRK